MAEYFEIRLHGVEHLQTLHLHVTADNTAVLAALNELRDQMSDLSNTTDALVAAEAARDARTAEDFAHLRELVETALATETAATAEAAALRADADATVARLQELTSHVTAEDPDPSFPAAPPVEPPADGGGGGETP